jgi:hypothetical protein
VITRIRPSSPPTHSGPIPRGGRARALRGWRRAKRLPIGRREPISLLISNIGRGANRDAGLEGLKELREKSIYDGPAVVYTLRPTSGQVDEASGLNAAITSSPDELRSFVHQYLPSAAPQAQTHSSASSPTSTATSRGSTEA